jgi:hypothetical protein
VILLCLEDGLSTKIAVLLNFLQAHRSAAWEKNGDIQAWGPATFTCIGYKHSGQTFSMEYAKPEI